MSRVIEFLAEWGFAFVFFGLLFAVPAVATRKKWSWFLKLRERQIAQNKIVAFGIMFAYWVILGALLALGSIVASRFGLKPLHSPRDWLLWYALPMGIFQPLVTSFISRRQQKLVIEDWLDWPEMRENVDAVRLQES
jgi:hypothetical protein